MFIFTALHYAGVLYAVALHLSICLSVLLFSYAFICFAVHSVGVEEERELQTFDSVPNVRIMSYCSLLIHTDIQNKTLFL